MLDSATPVVDSFPYALFKYLGEQVKGVICLDKGKYNELRIRNVDPAILLKFEDLARNKGISRNEYIKRILEKNALSSEIKLVEDKYISLTKDVLETVSAITDRIEHLDSEIARLGSELRELLSHIEY